MPRLGRMNAFATLPHYSHSITKPGVQVRIHSMNGDTCIVSLVSDRKAAPQKFEVARACVDFIDSDAQPIVAFKFLKPRMEYTSERVG